MMLLVLLLSTTLWVVVAVARSRTTHAFTSAAAAGNILGGRRRCPPSTSSSTLTRRSNFRSGTSPSCLRLAAASDAMQDEVFVEVRGSIANIAKKLWNGFLDEHDSPFLDWEFLNSLEASGCATDGTGWAPLHLLVHRGSPEDDASDNDGQEILAAVPLYVKGHSLGEFIFDQGWAEAAYEAGIPYYPKLLMAVPFTPASGRRILVQPGLSGPISGQVHKTVGLFLRQLCGQGRLSSVHVNFCTDEEVRGLTDAGYLYRKSMQYHWRNEDRLNGGTKYDTFGDYLRNFASKRRIKIKRERRSVEEAGVVVRVYRGEEITDSMLEDMFHMYKTTIDKMEWGRLYLNKEFFQLLGGGFRKNLCFIFAEKDGRAIAGTFNVVKGGRFFGRYWGYAEGAPYVKNLHFEVCYYKAIEYCIQEGLDVMEPGAGGGDFKFLRGFDPQTINSVSWLSHPSLRRAVDNFLNSERLQIDEAADYLNSRSALGKRQGTMDHPTS